MAAPHATVLHELADTVLPPLRIGKGDSLLQIGTQNDRHWIGKGRHDAPGEILDESSMFSLLPQKDHRPAVLPGSSTALSRHCLPGLSSILSGEQSGSAGLSSLMEVGR